MVLNHLRIKSRSKLLPIAAVGLLLMNARSFISLSHHLISTSTLIGTLLFFLILWNLARNYAETSSKAEAIASPSWTTATLAITGTTLLLISHFAKLRPSLHSVVEVAGWLFVLACWSFPKSRWQAIALCGVYLIAISDIRPLALSSFRTMPAYITIALATLWLAISALTYLFLSRPKLAPTASGLN